MKANGLARTAVATGFERARAASDGGPALFFEAASLAVSAGTVEAFEALLRTCKDAEQRYFVEQGWHAGLHAVSLPSPWYRKSGVVYDYKRK